MSGEPFPRELTIGNRSLNADEWEMREGPGVLKVKATKSGRNSWVSINLLDSRPDRRMGITHPKGERWARQRREMITLVAVSAR